MADDGYSKIVKDIDGFIQQAEKALSEMGADFPSYLEIRRDPEAPKKALTAHGQLLLQLSDWVVRVGQYQLRIRGFVKSMEGQGPYQESQAITKDMNYRFSVLSDLKGILEGRKWDIYHSTEALRSLYSGEIRMASMG